MNLTLPCAWLVHKHPPLSIPTMVWERDPLLDLSSSLPSSLLLPNELWRDYSFNVIVNITYADDVSAVIIVQTEVEIHTFKENALTKTHF